MRNLKCLICFLLIFTLILLQAQVLSSHQIYAQNEESPISEEVKNEVSPKISAIKMDRSNIEVMGTPFRFIAICEGKNLSYEWTVFKDFDEIYKKEYSKENFLFFTMNESGKYQVVVTIKDDQEKTISKLSEEIKIIHPLKINSVDIDQKSKQPVHTPLNFSVSAQGSGLVYHWYIFKDSNVVYDGLLSENNSILYTPNEPGVYKGIVYVKDLSGKCISEYSEEIIVYKNVLSEKEKLEAMINETNFSSKTNYFVWVDTNKHKTYIFEGKNKNWSLFKTMLCTDGTASTPTIKGNFEICGRGPWLTSYNGKVKAKYKVRFFQNYYFHSILFDSKGKNIVDSRLGKSLSHGCVRLSVDNAKWIYDHIKDGTGVCVN
ncbi:L,D-transpeptidase family protein [Inediibacterium massiliense]|uniref:L,D-transpeptidase family protein n=1 Tax=Inediibacterium massiliense TaxID=1658111 RepID=UPI0006B4580E|nr:L,D-transpeptidase family protein [Inediibacterium massiliense]